ncbi:MAG: AAA family ATPase [Gallionellaceae bacterium]|nr:AAA family ATPase [Gallionellaceae bacterium]
MYLEHFGLDSPPFKITPVTDFFFPGANRGEILDALIYAITESEGIIKVTGEVGSGKTMLCRMLLERPPLQVEIVYLAYPSLSREEMLYAIADGLGLHLEGQRINVIMQNLQNLLAQKTAEGKRVVVLVDEAHAMPLDTLEELRLLYNLQLGDHKMLQIVLFGQPELNYKLDQPNMRQLKDRIVHHFIMLPLSGALIESYLLFRMRTAGYRGPNVFSHAAVSLIGKASHGLMRRVNILADKSLLAAFVEDTHNIEASHVQAAIRDSELAPQPAWRNRKAVAAGGVALLAALLAAIGWLSGGAGKSAAPAKLHTPAATPSIAGNIQTNPVSAPIANTVAAAAVAGTPATSVPAPAGDAAMAALPPPLAAPHKSDATPQAVASGAGKVKSGPPPTLLQQRLAATQEMLGKRDKNSASIQLFYTEDTQPARMERFLVRAKTLGKLSEIYVLPARISGKDDFRVLYGSYPDIKAARDGIRQLPQRYKEAFTPAPYLLDGAQSPPDSKPRG